jgi:hypothetical protein
MIGKRRSRHNRGTWREEAFETSQDKILIAFKEQERKRVLASLQATNLDLSDNISINRKTTLKRLEELLKANPKVYGLYPTQIVSYLGVPKKVFASWVAETPSRLGGLEMYGFDIKKVEVAVRDYLASL